MAKQYHKENAGTELKSRTDSDGNERWYVEGGGKYGAKVKTFKNDERTKIRERKDDVVSEFMDILGPFDFSPDSYMSAEVIDVIGYNGGYSYTKGLNPFTNWVKSDYGSIFLVTRGSDFGLWKANTKAAKYGLQFEYSMNVFVGKYWGKSSSLKVSTLGGRGWEAPADFIGAGAGLWGSFYTNTWTPAWTGFSVGVGPGLGISVGPTETKILGRY